MSYICNITDLSQGGVVFQKQLQKHVISGPFGLYMPHNFPIRRNWSGFLWDKVTYVRRYVNMPLLNV